MWQLWNTWGQIVNFLVTLTRSPLHKWLCWSVTPLINESSVIAAYSSLNLSPSSAVTSTICTSSPHGGENQFGWLTVCLGKRGDLQGHTRSKEQFRCPKLQSKIHCAWTCSHLLENPFWVPIGMMLHVSKQPWSVFWCSEMLTRCLTPHARASGGTVSWDAQVHLSSCNSQHQGGKKASTNYTRPPQGLTPFARSPSSSSNKLQSAFDLIPIPFTAS